MEGTHETPPGLGVFLCILNLDYLPEPDQISSVIVAGPARSYAQSVNRAAVYQILPISGLSRSYVRNRSMDIHPDPLQFSTGFPIIQSIKAPRDREEEISM